MRGNLHYPQGIIRQLDMLAELLVTEARPRAILLLGSAARGELAYTQLDGQLEVFSDYECLVVTERRLPGRKRRRIAIQLVTLEQQFGQRNPLFHIDLAFRERRRLRTLPHIIFTYELKANARILRGEDVRPLLPQVTLANLDLRDTNEILIRRLWAILLHTPRRLLRGPLTRLEGMVWGYVLSRNALDLTTVLLPHEGVLLPTYRQRVAYLREHYPSLRLSQTFGPDFPPFLQDCLDRRVDLDFAQRDLHALYAATLEYLEQELAVLFADQGASFTTLPQYSGRIFNEWPISRGEWVNLARITLVLTRHQGPSRALRWLRLPKKGWLTLGLLAMHKALLAFFAGQGSQAEQHLAHASNILQTLSIAPPPQPQSDLLQRWLVQREAWGEFWRQYIRLGEASYKQRFQQVMQWTHE